MEALEKLSQAVLGEHVGHRSCQSVLESPGGKPQRSGAATRCCPSIPGHPQPGALGSCGAEPDLPSTKTWLQSRISLVSGQSPGCRLGSARTPGRSARARPGAPGAEQPWHLRPHLCCTGDGDINICLLGPKMRLVHIPLWIQQMHNGSLVSIKKFIAACWSTQTPAYHPLRSCHRGKTLQ